MPAAGMCTLLNMQALVSLVRGSDEVGRRLIVLPAFETLPFKSKGNAAEDELTHKVAAFAQTADKTALKVFVMGKVALGMISVTGPVVLSVGAASTPGLWRYSRCAMARCDTHQAASIESC